MAVPFWRQRQIDDAEVAREQRAIGRTGVLCGLDAESTIDESTSGICSKCFLRRERADLRLDGKGGMICRTCLEALR